MLLGLLTLVFFLSRLLAGDPTILFIDPRISPEIVEELRIQFGLDKPLLEQYVLWISSTVQGDLGHSFMFNMPVAEVLSNVVPNSFLLGTSALALEISIAISVSLAAFSSSGRWVDRFIANGTLIGYSLPSFWIGILLLTLFSYGWEIFPSSHMHSSGITNGPVLQSLLDTAWHLVLPALTIAIPGAAGLARYLLTKIRATVDQEYVLLATSLGQSKRRIFWSTILPNSAGPMVSQIGVEFGIVLTGVLVTEVLFSWPGMGQTAVAAIFARDYPLILGCTLVAGIIVTIGNLLADIGQMALDPRLEIPKNEVA